MDLPIPPQSTSSLYIIEDTLDGAACAVLIEKYMPGMRRMIAKGNTLDYIFDNWLTGIPGSITNNVLLIGISPKKGKIKELLGKGYKILLIDHHKSSESLNDVLTDMVYNKESSGVKLTYEWLKSRGYDVAEYESFIHFCHEYTMEDKVEEVMSYGVLDSLFDLYGIDNFIERFRTNPDIKLSGPEEQIVKQYEANKCDYILSAAYTSSVFEDNKGRIFKAICAEQWPREIGKNILYIHKEPRIDYAVIINPNNGCISLCSRKGEVNVKEIAEANGGFGEETYAEFQFEKEIVCEDVIEKVDIVF